MTKDEIERFIRKIGGLFPNQVTVEQAKFLRQELAGFTITAADQALSEHRASREFLNYPQLIEGCRAAERSEAGSTSNTNKEGSWFDVRRRLNPQLKDATDLEVAIRVYRQHLHKSGGSEAYRRKFLSECRTAVILAGVEAKDADSWAQTILWGPHEFRQALADLRGESPSSPREVVEPEIEEVTA